jgi:hypothetical protein
MALMSFDDEEYEHNLERIGLNFLSILLTVFLHVLG